MVVFPSSICRLCYVMPLPHFSVVRYQASQSMVEYSMKVFIDEFFFAGNTFKACLEHLSKAPQICVEQNLVFNWKKCHFMVKEGIMFVHKVSEKGLEIDI